MREAEETMETPGFPLEAPEINRVTRLLSIAQGLYQVCGFASEEAMTRLKIPVLPEWAANVCQQLRLTIFKRFVDLKPHDGFVDWRNFGRLMGVGLREVGFIQHDLRGDATALNELLASILGGGAAVVHIAEIRSATENSFRCSLGLPAPEQNEFLAGLAEGQGLLLDTQGQFTGDRGRTAIYFELLGRWVEIEAMRHANPPKTRLELYCLIAPNIGDAKHERLGWFNDVCDDIGLILKERGRPRKSRLA